MGLMHYFGRAFNARPWGMFVPPNWVGLAAFGLLGIEVPGLWLVGAGLEVAYLLGLGTNARFQRLVDGEGLQQKQKSADQQVAEMLARLPGADRDRYVNLEKRCHALLVAPHGSDIGEESMAPQAEGLSRLLYVYLRLLTTRAAIGRAVDEAAGSALDAKIKDVSQQLKSAGSPELHHSLADQLAILAERKKRQGEARDKLAYVNAEMERIEQQVELMRESMLVNADPATLSSRIDSISETLQTTSAWIKEQQAFYGATEDASSSPIDLWASRSQARTTT